MEKIEHHNGAPDANGGDGIPRYAQIQKILEERLVDGTYPLGSLIPPEIELAAEFNSSRTTIREALRYLRERGYVERRQGVGTRVISDSPKSSYNQSYTSLEELFQVAIETYFVIMGVEKVVLDHDQAELVVACRARPGSGSTASAGRRLAANRSVTSSPIYPRGSSTCCRNSRTIKGPSSHCWSAIAATSSRKWCRKSARCRCPQISNGNWA